VDDLIAFLSARLDEAERVARSWRTPRVDVEPHDVEFRHHGDGSRRAFVTDSGWLTYVEMTEEEYQERVTIPVDPDQFVLADINAKRRILGLYREERTRRDIYESDEARAEEDDEQATRRRSAAARTRGLEMAIEILALPYALHPDYDEEWRLGGP
jgi:hypothetical protein